MSTSRFARHPDLKLYADFIRSQVDRALAPTQVSDKVPLRYHPEVDDYTMSMGMAMTPKGRIWLGHFAGGDNDQAVIVLSKSDDGGLTFGNPEFIVDPGYAECGVHVSAVVGNLWTAPDGRLFLFFTQSVGWFDGRGGSWYTVCNNPDDVKPVWSSPVRIWHGASLNKPTVLKDGTWLLPISLWCYNPSVENAFFTDCFDGQLFPELNSERRAHIFASRDQGKTWEKRGSAINDRPTFDEHIVLERADGSLLMYLRDLDGMTQAESFDQGYTWSKTVKTPFPSATARFFMTRLASGNALLVKYSNPEVPTMRSHLTAYISKDDGKTWEGGLLLDERLNISYPDGFQAPDGRIFVQYDYKRECGEIALAVFREEDALAGNNVSGQVLLKHPIVRSRTQRLAAEAEASK